MQLRVVLNMASERYPEYKRVFQVMNSILTTQIYFISRFLTEINPKTPVLVSEDKLPRLRAMVPLPPGLDPLLITQARALDKILWINARKNPALIPAA